MISNKEYQNNIKLPSQLKKLSIRCNKCNFDIIYCKELLKVEKKYKVLYCPECKHKIVFL